MEELVGAQAGKVVRGLEQHSGQLGVVCSCCRMWCWVLERREREGDRMRGRRGRGSCRNESSGRWCHK